MRVQDERFRLFLSTGTIVLLGAFALLFIGLFSTPNAVPAVATELNADRAEQVARDYLNGLKQLPGQVEKAKVERYWVPENRYWETTAAGKPGPKKPKFVDSWVVTLYYTDLHPSSWKTVFVEVKSGRIVGGSRSLP